MFYSTNHPTLSELHPSNIYRYVAITAAYCLLANDHSPPAATSVTINSAKTTISSRPRLEPPRPPSIAKNHDRQSLNPRRQHQQEDTDPRWARRVMWPRPLRAECLLPNQSQCHSGLFLPARVVQSYIKIQFNSTADFCRGTR